MAEEVEKLGIENIKEVLGFSVDLGKQTIEAFEDGKISMKEGVAFAVKIPKAWATAKRVKVAIEEAKDLDPEEAQELILFLLERLDLENWNSEEEN